MFNSLDKNMDKIRTFFENLGMKNKFLVKFKYINKTYCLEMKYELFNSLGTKNELFKV